MNGIFNALSFDDEETQDLALQALAEVPAVGYNHIFGYLQSIGEFTLKLL